MSSNKDICTLQTIASESHVFTGTDEKNPRTSMPGINTWSFNKNPYRPPKKKELEESIPSVVGNLISIINEYGGNPFTIKVNVPNKSITIPRIKTKKMFSIDWGDGTFFLGQEETENIIHMYKDTGEYIVRIDGDICDMNFSEVNELVEIYHWGNAKIASPYVFSSCKNLVFITAEDSPDLSKATNLSQMFADCPLFNCDLSNWDVSNVTCMESMFANCAFSDPKLGNWNVGNVTDMANMFMDCKSFNSDISKWNVSKVTTMSTMFYGCHLFNSDIGGWEVGNVKNMDALFYGCKSFDSDLSNWNTSKVAIMLEMFYGCRMFNCDISRWNVVNVWNMGNMFEGCDSFTADVSSWYQP